MSDELLNAATYVADGGEDADGAVESASGDETVRSISTIKFPYNDLDDAVKVAVSLMNKRGGQAETSELAADLGQVPTSGAFRLRVSATRMFGLTHTVKKRVSLTDLGKRIIQDEHARSGRIEAFLHVELYAKLYETYKDGTLPEDQGLEAAIHGMGVTANQAARARQVFARSAKQAGFFDAGTNRLVKPYVDTADEKPAADPPPDPNAGGSAGGGEVNDVLKDPMLLGLLRRMLPAEGEPFPAARRRLFFSALALNLDVIYGPPEDGPLDLEPFNS